jgi:hypothetical protein
MVKSNIFMLGSQSAPHIITVFNIIVVDLPPIYGVVLGRDWSSMIGGYIMNDGSCMMLPDKGGAMIKVPREPMRPFSFKKKDNELMEYYIDGGYGKVRSWQAREIYWRIGALLYGELMLQQTETTARSLQVVDFLHA